MSDSPETINAEPTPTPEVPAQFYKILGSDGSERAIFGDAANAQARAEALASFQDGVTFEVFDEAGEKV